MQVLESLGIVSDNKNISITKQMKILLLVPKYNFSKDKYHDYTFPIGLGYVSSALKNAGYEVSCVNLNQIYGDVKDIVKEILDKDDYDVVCTGGNDFIYLTTKSMIETVREHPSKPMFILAGPLLTHEPELIFKDLRPDFGVIGEGEESIMELLDCIERNGDLNQVEGIIYPDQTGKIIKTKRREPIRDINVLPFPDYESFGFDEHLKHMHCNDLYHNHCLDYPRTYCLLGSRGCAFNCTFCWHSENYRWRSVDNIMDELRIVVKKYDINNLLIADDCFSVKQERVYEFCKKIKELSNEVGWNIKWTCQLLVHTVDNKLLETMKDAGCESISYGFETMNPNVLRSMMKPITPEQIDRAWRSTITAKIALQGHFIFGDSAETIESARDTLNYWKNNCNGQIGLAFIQPYPGSVMYQRCIQKGIIKDRLDYIKTQQNPHNCINMTDKIHPFYKKIALKAARELGLNLTGLDLMTKDISKKSNYAILELNSYPSLSMHENPDVGKPVPVNKLILKSIFPGLK